MRDILSDLEQGLQLSDPDPIRRAQIQMKTPLPKRFYAEASVAASDTGHRVLLDGRGARTPGGAALELPGAAAARLVSDEFAAQVDVIDPVTMPVYRLANAAIDGVAADTRAVLEDVARFATSDLVCYRADAPERLVALQAEAWDPIVAWARSELGARLYLAEGIVHVEQPPEAMAAVVRHLEIRNEPFRLACLHVMTSITGSALIAMMVEAAALTPEDGWRAAHVDEDWNVAQWGEDAEARNRRQFRHRDYMAAARMLAALDFEK